MATNISSTQLYPTLGQYQTHRPFRINDKNQSRNYYSTTTMPALAISQLSSIPEFEVPRSFNNLAYPLRRSPSYISLVNTTPLDDISPGRSQIFLTFHLLQSDGTVDRSTQY